MRPPLAQLREHRRRIADKRDCRADILTDLRRIDIDVNHRLIRAQTAWPAHRPVVRARAEDHQQIALTDCLVGGRRAALSEHAEIKRMLRRQRADAHHRGNGGQPAHLAQPAHAAARSDRAAAHDEQRPSGSAKRPGHAFHLAGMPLDTGLISAD